MRTVTDQWVHWRLFVIARRDIQYRRMNEKEKTRLWGGTATWKGWMQKGCVYITGLMESGGRKQKSEGYCQWKERRPGVSGAVWWLITCSSQLDGGRWSIKHRQIHRPSKNLYQNNSYTTNKLLKESYHKPNISMGSGPLGLISLGGVDLCIWRPRKHTLPHVKKIRWYINTVPPS